MTRKTKVYDFDGHLIAAYSLSGAKRIARDRFGSAAGIKPVTGPVEYADENGHPIGSVDGKDCSSIWPKPEVIPDVLF